MEEREKIVSEEEAQKQFEAECRTPMTEEEARVAMADLDLDRMKLMVVREKWRAQLTALQHDLQSLEAELVNIELKRAVVFRRTLNKPEQAK